MADDWRYPSRDPEYRAAYNRAYRAGERWRVTRHVALRVMDRLDRDPGELVVPELGPCWVWRGARNAAGYGVVRDNRHRLVLVHRVTLALALERPIAPGMLACHRCDHRPCARPSHLYEGTYTDNALDRWERYDLKRPIGGEAVT